MPITVAWDNDEKTIIKICLTNPVLSWEEQDAAMLQVSEMACTVTHAVYVLVDGGSAAMPPGNALQHLRHSLESIPPNVKTLVGCADNPFVMTVIGTLARLMGSKRLRFVRGLGEAYAVIRKAQAETAQTVMPSEAFRD